MHPLHTCLYGQGCPGRQEARIKTAGFSQIKYLEQLDRNELSEGIKHLLPRLETLDFIHEHHLLYFRHLCRRKILVGMKNDMRVRWRNMFPVSESVYNPSVCCVFLTERNIQVLKTRLYNALRIEYFGASEKLFAKIEIFSGSRNVLFFSRLCYSLVLYASKNAVIPIKRFNRSI